MTCITGQVAIRIIGADVARLGLENSTITGTPDGDFEIVYCAQSQEQSSCGIRVANGRSSIEGPICGCSISDPSAICRIRNATITVMKQNGDAVTLLDAYFAGQVSENTGTGEMTIRFESERDAQIVPSFS